MVPQASASMVPPEVGAEAAQLIVPPLKVIAPPFDALIVPPPLQTDESSLTEKLSNSIVLQSPLASMRPPAIPLVADDASSEPSVSNVIEPPCSASIVAPAAVTIEPSKTMAPPYVALTFPPPPLTVVARLIVLSPWRVTVLPQPVASTRPPATPAVSALSLSVPLDRVMLPPCEASIVPAP